MAVKPEFNPDYLYFVTTTAEKHAHLFAPNWVRQILLDSLQFLRTSGRINLYAFVIMPNHIHFIARFAREHPLSAMLRDFKRHTARQMISRYQAESHVRMLNALRASNHDQRQEYKVWEDGYDARDVFTLDFLQQKLNYLHNNPCQEHWKLSELPEDYLWSSARFYLADQACIIAVDDVRELF